MSVADSIEQQREDALDPIHGDDLKLQPMNASARGYAQELDSAETERGARENPMLRISQDLITDIVHIRRSLLLNVTLSDVSHIELGGKTYRVKHVSDRPTKATVDFYCML